MNPFNLVLGLLAGARPPNTQKSLLYDQTFEIWRSSLDNNESVGCPILAHNIIPDDGQNANFRRPPDSAINCSSNEMSDCIHIKLIGNLMTAVNLSLSQFMPLGGASLPRFFFSLSHVKARSGLPGRTGGLKNSTVIG